MYLSLILFLFIIIIISNNNVRYIVFKYFLSLFDFIIIKSIMNNAQLLYIIDNSIYNRKQCLISKKWKETSNFHKFSMLSIQFIYINSCHMRLYIY